MVELRILTFAVLILLVFLFEWRVIVSPRLLRLYFRRYSLRLLLTATVVAAAFFAVLSSSSTPTSDAAVFCVVGITLVIGVSLTVFAYCDLFGPRINRRYGTRLNLSDGKRESCPMNLRLKGEHRKNASRVDEAPFIDVEADYPSDT